MFSVTGELGKAGAWARADRFAAEPIARAPIPPITARRVVAKLFIWISPLIDSIAELTLRLPQASLVPPPGQQRSECRLNSRERGRCSAQ